jgi:uncharacterized protein YraI
MRKGLRWSIGLLVCLVLVTAACDEVPTKTPSPSTSEEESVLRLPTRTLGPIVSFTPRFTATPIPSATYTPSITPIPSDTSEPPTLTPTLTPTATPTVAGVIRSTNNVNLREGPGTDYAAVLSVAPGTELGVVGLQTDAAGRDWYKVAFTDEDGQTQYLWVSATLVETNFMDVVSVIPTTTSPPPPSPGTPAAPAPTQEPNSVRILAYCRQKGITPPSPTTGDSVYIEWSWFVARPEYMQDHLDNASYEVRLDGKLLDNWAQYATKMKLEGGVWIVYWYYPVGRLSAGEHKIDFRLTWSKAVTDGYKNFGPDTPNEADTGDCTFTVTAP